MSVLDLEVAIDSMNLDSTNTVFISYHDFLKDVGILTDNYIYFTGVSSGEIDYLDLSCYLDQIGPSSFSSYPALYSCDIDPVYRDEIFSFILMNLGEGECGDESYRDRWWSENGGYQSDDAEVNSQIMDDPSYHLHADSIDIIRWCSHCGQYECVPTSDICTRCLPPSN